MEGASLPSQPALDDSQWELVAEHVETFVQAWECAVHVSSDGSGPANIPQLEDFLPAAESGIQQLVLVELVKVDLEYRWLHRRQPCRLSDYCLRFPLLVGWLDANLVYEEFHVRRQAGEIVSQAEYLEQFPHLATSLAQLWSSCDSSQKSQHASTVIYGGAKDLANGMGRRPGDGLHDLQFGDVIDEFQIVRKLGQGTFGSVYLAMQQSMQRMVALKVTADRGDESRTLAQLDHDNIVRVFDQRILPDRGLRLMYMQYIAGGCLSNVVKNVQRTPLSERTSWLLFEVIEKAAGGGELLPETRLQRKLKSATWPEVVCWIGARLSSALNYAHRNGVIHRDLKPANVLLAPDCLPKLVDFNISFSSRVQGSTPATYFGGSLAYMSPEQLEAAHPAHPREPEELDGRSDLYSLAIMMVELLTGQRPFKDPSRQANWSSLLDELLQTRHIDPAELVWEGEETWPEGLARTLRRCLQPDRQNRPANASELTRAFELCLRPQPRRLVYPKPTVVMNWIGRHPLALLMFASMFPNIVFAFFNVLYNASEVVTLHPELRSVIWYLHRDLILVTIPAGVGIGIYFAWEIAQAVRYRRAPDEDIVRLRHLCAHFGHTASRLSLVTWLLSGVAFAILAGMHLPAFSDQIQIFLSFMLRGLMAAVYPFFPSTFVAIRFLYPRLIRLATMSDADEADLNLLRWRVNVYQLLAAIVPMVTLALLVLTDAPSSNMLSFLVFRSGVSFAIVLIFSRLIMDDIAALRYTIRSHPWPDD